MVCTIRMVVKKFQLVKLIVWMTPSPPIDQPSRFARVASAGLGFALPPGRRERSEAFESVAYSGDLLRIHLANLCRVGNEPVSARFRRDSRHAIS